MSEPPPSDHTETPYYDDLLRRARIVATFRKIQRREAHARMMAAVPRTSAIDLSAVEQARRGRG